MTLKEVCRVLGVGRSGYYKWLHHESASKSDEKKPLDEEIRQIFWIHRRRYGARRIANELRDRGIACERKKVRKRMKSMGIVAIQPKSFKPRGTESRHRLGYNDNLLMESDITDVRQAWVGDITYVPSKTGFYYLAVLMDLHSRRIVGWQLNSDMKEELVIDALKKAIGSLQPPAGMLHHTDRGGQYAGKQYRQILSRASMRQSMSRANNCYDNAFMESCFGTIKNELDMDEYRTVGAARTSIGSYINYYNFERKHSALGYRTPVHFESENEGQRVH